MLMTDKNVLISGVASKRSIAHAIYLAMNGQGANVYLTYPNNSFKERLIKLFPNLPEKNLLKYDAKHEDDLIHIQSFLKSNNIKLDCIVHAVAYADQTQISGMLSDQIEKTKFLESIEISAYSFPSMLKHLKSELNDHSSAITLSYIGSKRAVPNYNAMGLAKACLESSVIYLANELGSRNIRVNCISAGPIKTLAASGIKGFKEMLKYDEEYSPLPGNTTIYEVADTALFLASNLSRGMTGQTLYVDHGFHLTAFPGTL